MINLYHNENKLNLTRW